MDPVKLKELLDAASSPTELQSAFKAAGLDLQFVHDRAGNLVDWAVSDGTKLVRGQDLEAAPPYNNVDYRAVSQAKGWSQSQPADQHDLTDQMTKLIEMLAQMIESIRQMFMKLIRFVFKLAGHESEFDKWAADPKNERLRVPRSARSEALAKQLDGVKAAIEKRDPNQLPTLTDGGVDAQAARQDVAAVLSTPVSEAESELARRSATQNAPLVPNVNSGQVRSQIERAANADILRNIYSQAANESVREQLFSQQNSSMTNINEILGRESANEDNFEKERA